jgi:Icc-related predicted phosphoesterase
MKILHCADFHASDQWFRWLINESARFDLVCLAGDLLDLNRHRATGAQLDKVLTHLRKVRVPMAVCSGNHDEIDGEDPRLVDAAWLKELRGPKVWVDGDQFTMGGHAFRVIGWSSPLPAAEAPGEIFITHCPPDKCATGIVRGGTDFGSFEHGDLCRDPYRMAPRALIGGHCHDRQRWWAKVGRTWSFNPGRFEGPFPAHVVLDLERNIATYQGPSAGAGETRISLGPG